MSKALATRNIALLLIGAFLLIGGVSIYFPRTSGALTTGPATQSCTASSTVVSIGNQFANVLVGTSSRRAWATIENIRNASNTVALGLNDARVTAAAPNFEIGSTTAANPIRDFRFGLNTENPYTGAVRAITDVGSTTVIVTECTYTII